MKAFVTGGNGFIGSALIKALEARGDEITCLMYPGTKADWLASPAVTFIEGDITAPNDAMKDAIEEADLIFHLAGARIGLTSAHFYRVNAGGTQELLSVCRKRWKQALKQETNTKRFILVSSATVSGPCERDDPSPEERINPLTPYAKSKVESERIALEEFSDIPVTVIRPTAIYGPRTTEWVALLEASLRWRIHLKMGVFHNAHVNFCHVDDLVRAMLLAAENKEAIGEAFHIGGFEYNWTDLGFYVSKHLGKKTMTIRMPIPILFLAAGATHILSWFIRQPFEFNWWRAVDFSQKNWLFRLDKAKEILGYEPQITLDEGGGSTLRWFFENEWVTNWGGKKYVPPAVLPAKQDRK